MLWANVIRIKRYEILSIMNSERSEILNFLSILIDRKNRKSKEKGLTSYIYYSLIVLVIYRLIGISPEFFVLVQQPQNLLQLSVVCNIIIVIVILVIAFSAFEKDDFNYRLTPTHGNRTSSLSLFAFGLLTIIIAFLSYLVLKSEILHGVNKWMFYMNFICSIIFTLISIIAAVFNLHSTKKKYFLGEGSIAKSSYDIVFTIIFFVLVLTYSVVNLNLFKNSLSNLSETSSIIEGAIYILTVPTVILLIGWRTNHENSISRLEDLEKKSYLLGYSADEIKSQLIHRHLPLEVTDWILFQRMSIKKHQERLLEFVQNDKNNETEENQTLKLKIKLEIEEIENDIYLFRSEEYQALKKHENSFRLLLNDLKSLKRLFDELQ